MKEGAPLRWKVRRYVPIAVGETNAWLEPAPNMDVAEEEDELGLRVFSRDLKPTKSGAEAFSDERVRTYFGKDEHGSFYVEGQNGVALTGGEQNSVPLASGQRRFPKGFNTEESRAVESSPQRPWELPENTIWNLRGIAGKLDMESGLVAVYLQNRAGDWIIQREDIFGRAPVIEMYLGGRAESGKSDSEKKLRFEEEIGAMSSPATSPLGKQGRVVVRATGDWFWDAKNQEWNSRQTTVHQDGDLIELKQLRSIDPVTGNAAYSVHLYDGRFSGRFGIVGWLTSLSPQLLINNLFHSYDVTLTPDRLVVEMTDPEKKIHTVNDVRFERMLLHAYGGEQHEIQSADYPLGADITPGNRINTYSTTISRGIPGRLDGLDILRRSHLLPDEMELSRFERPRSSGRYTTDPRGVIMGSLRAVETIKGWMDKDKIVKRRKATLFYEDDLNKSIPAGTGKEAQAARLFNEDLARLWSLSEKHKHVREKVDSHELGHVVIDYMNDPGAPTTKTTSLNFGIEPTRFHNGTRIQLQHVIDYDMEHVPSHHWVDPLGRDLKQTKLNAQSESAPADFEFDLARNAWIPKHSTLYEQKSNAFKERENGHNGLENINTGTADKEEKETDLSRFFFDERPSVKLSQVLEKPSKNVGDPKSQKVYSFYDPVGFIRAQTENFGPVVDEKSGAGEFNRFTYYYQLAAREFNLIEFNEAYQPMPSAFSGHDALNGVDFLAFLAQGDGVDGLKVKITDAKGRSVVVDNDFSNSNGFKFWSPFFNDPLVEERLRADGRREVRFVDVRPMQGHSLRFPIDNATRSFIIPVEKLRGTGLDLSSLRFEVQAKGNVEVSSVERLGQSENENDWKMTDKIQKEFFPKATLHVKIPDLKSQVVDLGNGVVQVTRGKGDQTKITVFDNGLPVSVTYWQKNGETYDCVRFYLAHAISPYLQIPEYVESYFGGWLSRVITTHQVSGGRLQVNVANVDKAVAIVLFPNDTEDTNNPATLYFPMGLFDPKAKFPRINANIVNGVLRTLNPSLEKEYSRFGGENNPQRFVLEQLNPYAVKALVEGTPLNLIPSWKDRSVPEFDRNKGPAWNLDQETLIASIKSSMGDSTRLPETDMGTRRSAFPQSSNVSEIIRGLLDMGEVSLAEEMMGFYDRATTGGEQYVLSAYDIGSGARRQFSDEYGKPGIAIPTAESNVAVARAALALAEKTGDKKYWELAVRLTQRSLEFLPDNNFFWFKGASKERAERLVEVWDNLRSDQKERELSADDLNFIEKTLETARRQSAETPRQVEVIQRGAIDALVMRLAKTPQDVESLTGILTVSGGFSEYKPRNLYLLREMGVTLTPEPDNYRVGTNKEALILLREWETVLTHGQPPTSLGDFQTEILVSRRNLERWFKGNILPHVKKGEGFTPAHFRQQLWITGVKPTGTEGKNQPYVLIPSRWTPLESSLAGAEAALLLGEKESTVRQWMENYLKVFYGQGNGASGLDFSPETMGRTEGKLFSSELSVRFGQLSQRIHYPNGVNFALNSLRDFADNKTGLLREASGVDPTGLDVDLGVPTGDGRVILPKLDKSDFGVSMTSTVKALRFTSDVSGTGAKKDLQENIKVPDLDLSKASQPDRFSIMIRDPLSFVSGQALIILGVLFSLAVLIWKGVTWFWNSNRSYSPHQALLDVAIAFLVLLPIPILLYGFGLTGLGVSLSAAWLYPASQIITSGIGARRFEGYAALRLRKWRALENGQRIYDDALIEAATDRYYKRVLGTYQVVRDGVPTDIFGASVPNEYVSADPALAANQHVGTGEIPFLPGLAYIHILTLEYYRRLHPGWTQEELAAAAAPIMLDPNALNPGVDKPELMRLDRYLRRAGWWFRDQISRPNVNSHIYAETELYFSHMAEKLRKILARPLMEDGTKVLSADDRAAFEMVLGELGLLEADTIQPEEFGAKIEAHADRHNLISIHPYWTEIVSFAPRLILFAVTFAFIYARDSLSPLQLLSNNFFNVPSWWSGLGATGLLIGLLALCVSYWFYFEGNFLKDKTTFGRIQRLVLSNTGRAALMLSLAIGCLGTLMFIPGVFGYFSVTSLEITSLLLPAVVAGIMFMEILALLTNRISFLGTMRFYQFRTTAIFGHPRAVAFMAMQYALFLAFAWWVTSYVVPFFEGYLVSAWGYQDFLKPGFNFSTHAIGALVIAGAISLFIYELTRFRLADPSRNPEPYKRYLKVFPLVTLVFFALSFFLDIYRPVGGMVIGGFALFSALYLAHYAIFVLVIGLTAITSKIGKFRNLLEIGVGLAVLEGILYLIGGSNSSSFALWAAVMGIRVIIQMLLMLTAMSAGDPAFSTGILGAGIAAFYVPMWFGTSYAQGLFFGLISLAVLVRAVRFIAYLVRRSNNHAAVDSQPAAFGIWITGGQPMSSQALKSVNNPLLYYMTLWRTVIKPNAFHSPQDILDVTGKHPVTDAEVEEALGFLFQTENEHQRTIFGEEAIAILGEPLTPVQMELDQATDENGRNLNLIVRVNDPREAELLRLGYRLERLMVTRIPIRGSQRDTLVYAIQLAHALRARGLTQAPKFYIQSNKYDPTKPSENNPDDKAPSQLFDLDGAKKKEMDERLAAARFITITTGISAEVDHNWTFNACKSGAQNGNSGSFRNLKKTYVLDRNAQSFTLEETVDDINSLLTDPTIAGIFPIRTTPNIAFPVGSQSDMGEYGFSMFEDALVNYLGGTVGEMVAIGWGNLVALPYNDLFVAFSDPAFPYRFNVGNSSLDRSFGGIHGFLNLPHVSEDFLQIQFSAEGMKSMGITPRLLTSRGMHYKLREHSTMMEMVLARPRWSGGGDPGQKGRDILAQRLRDYGSDSIFMREMQRNRARYYLTAPLGMINVTFTPLLIMTGYTPFAGILLLFWVIGIVANQVLTLNGLASYIDRAGFWAGLSIWLSQRFRDMILFAPLTFIEFYGVMETLIKDVRYGFIFNLSGGAKMEDYNPNVLPGMLKTNGPYDIFRWMFGTGVITTLVNLYAISRLDLLNALMLYPMLVFTTGLVIGSYIYLHQKGPKKQSLLGWRRWTPKMIGVGLAALIMIGMSLGLGLFSNDVIVAPILLGASFFLFFILFPGTFIVTNGATPRERLHNFWVLVMWVGIGLLASLGVSLPLSGTQAIVTGALIGLVPFFTSMAILSRMLHIGGPFRQSRASVRKMVRTSYVKHAPLFLKDPFTLPTIRRSAILGMVGLVWLALNPTPALVTARVLDFNMTVNYLQIGQSLGITVIALSIIFIFGFTTMRLYTWANSRQFRTLYRWFKEKQENRDTINYDMTSVIEALIQGVWVARDTRAPLKGSKYLRDMEEALETYDNPAHYFDRESRTRWHEFMDIVHGLVVKTRDTLLKAHILVLGGLLWIMMAETSFGMSFDSMSGPSRGSPLSSSVVFFAVVGFLTYGAILLRRALSFKKTPSEKVVERPASLDDDSVVEPEDAWNHVDRTGEISGAEAFRAVPRASIPEKFLSAMTALFVAIEAKTKDLNAIGPLVLVVQTEEELRNAAKSIQAVQMIGQEKVASRAKFIFVEQSLYERMRDQWAALKLDSVNLISIDLKANDVGQTLVEETSRRLGRPETTAQKLSQPYSLFVPETLAGLISISEFPAAWKNQIDIRNFNVKDELSLARALLKILLNTAETDRFFSSFKGAGLEMLIKTSSLVRLNA